MKIAYICSNYLPFIGGVEIHAQQVSRTLSERHTVSVAAMNFAPCRLPSALTVLNDSLLAPSYPNSVSGNVPVTSLTPNLLDRLVLLPMLLRVAPRLRRWFYHPINRVTHHAYRLAILPKIRRAIAGADVVHGLVNGDIGWAAQRASQAEGCPYVCTPFVHPGQWGDGPNDIAYYKRCDVVVGLVESDRAYLESLGVPPSKLQTVGVSPNLPDQVDAATFRLKHQLGHAPVILYVGRMMAAKGAAAVLRAAPVVWQNYPDARFVFIGPSAGNEAAIFTGADPRVLHLGRVDAQEKANAIAACTLMAMPSMSEILPTVYLEAWALRKPVIGGRAHGLTELVEGNGAGISVSQDPTDVARAITRLIRAPEQADQMGARGFELVQSNYNTKAVSQSLENIYISLSKSKTCAS